MNFCVNLIFTSCKSFVHLFKNLFHNIQKNVFVDFKKYFNFLDYCNKSIIFLIEQKVESWQAHIR